MGMISETKCVVLFGHMLQLHFPHLRFNFNFKKLCKILKYMGMGIVAFKMRHFSNFSIILVCLKTTNVLLRNTVYKEINLMS